MAADDEVVFVAQLAGHLIERSLHRAGVLGGLEVGKGLIAKLALRRARLNFGRECTVAIARIDCIPLSRFSFHMI